MEGKYSNEFDDMLYYYAFNYAVVHNEYEKGHKIERKLKITNPKC